MQNTSYRYRICGDLTDTTPIVYFHTFEEEQLDKIARLCKPNCILVDLPWNPRLTPWPAKRAFPKGNDFVGGAETYLNELVNITIPTIEKEIFGNEYREPIRGLTGYSLAGLFALFNAYHTDAFRYIGSMSGSLWYDDFLQYVLEHEPRRDDTRFYFSLGDREHRVREERMQRVAECTERIVEHLGKNYPVQFDWNSGGHFDEPELRMAKGIEALLNLG